MPDASSKQLVRMGQITTFAVLVTATVFGYYLRDLAAIFTYIQKFWSIAWPAVTAVFLSGFFFKRATAKGCVIAMITGPVWAILFTVAEAMEWVPRFAFLNRAGLDFLFCCLIIYVFRNTTGQIPASATVDRSFSAEAQAEVDSVPWFLRFNFWSLLLIAIVAALYIYFF